MKRARDRGARARREAPLGRRAGLDVCVHATVLDARRHGFEVIVITDGTRPVTPIGGREANEEMLRAGARFETTADAS